MRVRVHSCARFVLVRVGVGCRRALCGTSTNQQRHAPRLPGMDRERTVPVFNQFPSSCALDAIGQFWSVGLHLHLGFVPVGRRVRSVHCRTPHVSTLGVFLVGGLRMDNGALRNIRGTDNGQGPFLGSPWGLKFII